MRKWLALVALSLVAVVDFVLVLPLLGLAIVIGLIIKPELRQTEAILPRQDIQ